MQVVPLSAHLHHHVNGGNPETHHACEDYDVVEKVIGVQSLLQVVYFVLEHFCLLAFVDPRAPGLLDDPEFLEGGVVYSA